MLHPAKRPLADEAVGDGPGAQRARLDRYAAAVVADEQRPAASVPQYAASSSHAHQGLPFFPAAHYRDGLALPLRTDGGMAPASSMPSGLLPFAPAMPGRSFTPGVAPGADVPPPPLPASVAAPRAPAASSSSSSSHALAPAAAASFAPDGRPAWCSPAGWARVKWIQEQHPGLLPTPQEYAPTASERLEQVLAGEEAVIVYRSGAIELTRLWDKRKTGERVGCVRLILPLAHVCKEHGWPLSLVKAPEKRSKFLLRFALDPAAGTADATGPLYFEPTLAATFPAHQIWIRRAVASADQDAEPWVLYRQNIEQSSDPRVLSMERNIALFICLRLGS
jgi:hypothetical protein